MTDAPTSPCIKLCAIDPATQLCTGCLRSLDEIAGWQGFTPAQQRAVLASLADRRAARNAARRSARLARPQPLPRT
jgi:predicted Fe-S protein YdhL (DUF1289 family)